LIENTADTSTKTKLLEFQEELEMYVKSWSNSASKRLLLQWKAAEILENAIRDSKSRAREVKKLRDSVKPVVKLLKP
jgi:hypothetical protein